MMNYKKITKYIESKSSRFAFAIAMVFSLNSCENEETQIVTTLENLVWADEFDNTSLNASKWTYDIGDGTLNNLPAGWGNNELQYYTDRTENVEVKDGMLHITALKETHQGYSYTSGKILTKGLYETTFGRIEARIKLPWGKGLWPAFWMLGDDSDGTVIWPQIGEIDILEYRGQQPTITHGSVHGPGYSGGSPITKSYELTGDRFDTGFHIFGIEWGKNYINYYVDNVLYNQITPADLPDGTEWVFNDNKFYLILNLAVGGNFLANPDENTVFPQTMIVDYIKVYN